MATIGVEGASAKVAKAVIKAADPEGSGKELDYFKFVAALNPHGTVMEAKVFFKTC